MEWVWFWLYSGILSNLWSIWISSFRIGSVHCHIRPIKNFVTLNINVTVMHIHLHISNCSTSGSRKSASCLIFAYVGGKSQRNYAFFSSDKLKAHCAQTVRPRAAPPRAPLFLSQSTILFIQMFTIPIFYRLLFRFVDSLNFSLGGGCGDCRKNNWEKEGEQVDCQIQRT